MLRARLFLHLEWGLSCALRLRVEEQSLLVLRLRLLLVRSILLLLPLLCPARPAVSSVRRSPALADVAVARRAMGPVVLGRSVLGVGLLPLVVLLATGRGPIGPSDSSEDDRAETPPPIFGREPGGTPGDSRPAPAGDRSPRPGPSGWRLLQYRSGFGGRLSPAPSGKVDDDRSSALDALDIDRDDSFRSVLALIRTSTAWRSRRVYHQLDARLFLHRSMG